MEEVESVVKNKSQLKRIVESGYQNFNTLFGRQTQNQRSQDSEDSSELVFTLRSDDFWSMTENL